MITRIEIDGFKTFRNFRMDFSPLTVVAGANASGKSNLFDALQLLSRLAETDLKTAFGEQRGEPSELFTQYAPGQYVREMRFGVEMLLDRELKNNWGRETKLEFTRLRYELAIRREPGKNGLEELFVSSETLYPISGEKKPKQRFITTEAKNGKTAIFLSEKEGQGAYLSGDQTLPTVQSFLSAAEPVFFPHVFAAREEMRAWKTLQLDAETMRQPSPHLAKDAIGKRGQNLAAVLYRISKEDAYAAQEINRRLSDLVPQIKGVEVENDQENRQYILRGISEDGLKFPARLLSEGTLRLLAVCVLLHDDKLQGLIGLEEPENGVHPAALTQLASLLADLSADDSNSGAPSCQIIVNTHSPVLLGEIFKLKKDERIGVWFSQLVSHIGEVEGERRKIRISRFLPVLSLKEAPADFSEPEKRLTIREAIRYLQTADFEGTIQTLNEP